MTAAEIRDLTESEVRQQLEDREEEFSNLKLRLTTHQLDNPLSVREARREIARLKTALREHALGINALAGGAPQAKPEESK